MNAAFVGAVNGPRGGLYPRAHWWLLLALLVVSIGFAPSFLLRLGRTDVPHLVHGASAFAWMVLLATQAWLIRTNRRELHRVLGRWSWLLVAILVGAGFVMLKRMLQSTGPFEQAFAPLLVFIDVTSLAYFVGAYLVALALRRKMHLHARLMVSTVVLVLPPAIARLLLNAGVPGFPIALHASLACAELVALALIVHDARRWRVQPPYVVLLAFLVVQHAAMGFVAASPAWLAACRWYAAA